jgi:hypothetical protein
MVCAQPDATAQRISPSGGRHKRQTRYKPMFLSFL